MTHEQARALLKARALLEARGYTIVPPKKTEQPLEERLKARALLEARGYTVAPPKKAEQPPAAATSVQKQNVSPQIYTNGSYMQGLLHPSKWPELLDRTRPLPAGLNPSLALKEMSVFLSARITESVAQTYGILV